jgi:hypothetical protein
MKLCIITDLETICNFVRANFPQILNCKNAAAQILFTGFSLTATSNEPPELSRTTETAKMATRSRKEKNNTSKA